MSIHAWILHVFLDRKACYRQYVDYTFTKRYGWNKVLASICGFSISFFIAKLLNSGKGIPVYRGTRKILHTFDLSVQALSNGESIVIFPDIDYSDDSANVKNMYGGFLFLDKYYFKATGKHVSFVPLYVSKKKKLMIAEKIIFFKGHEEFNSERRIVHQEIITNLNELGKKCGDL
ncbi:glycerol acyltransferase [Neobacillus endophyticus]|uniref:glycerol acyltransferase n=1 Tax=Neobacillus endophyticus TaxID=2738405 RepID=UPI001FE7D2F1|nr:glycerol acyltransferase [Neobacillus endophyticus]